MLERTHDPSAYLRILHDPQVEPFVSLGTALCDATIADAITDPANVCLMAASGGFFYEQMSPEIYDAHVAFLPGARGPQVVHLTRQSLAYVFQCTDALAIRAFIAHDNRAARRLTVGVGFVPLRDAATLGTPGTEYLLTVKQWVKGSHAISRHRCRCFSR